MGLVAQLIAHGPDGLTLAVELAVLVLLLVLFGTIWLRERRRRDRRSRRFAEMRDDSPIDG